MNNIQVLVIVAIVVLALVIGIDIALKVKRIVFVVAKTESAEGQAAKLIATRKPPRDDIGKLQWMQEIIAEATKDNPTARFKGCRIVSWWDAARISLQSR